jgi:hypothetical protein
MPGPNGDTSGRKLLASPTRWIVGSAVLALVVWLFLEPSSTKRRVRGLNLALAAGQIGGVSAGERARLAATVDVMLEALGIDARPAVNSPHSFARLNIYTTSPAAAVYTHCGYGNALYDPDLDTIFVDQSFFDHRGYLDIYRASPYSAVMGMKDDLVFPEIFSRFVLLHELGHRQLHGPLAGFHAPVSSLPRGLRQQREREADAFAIRGMRLFYELAKRRGTGLVGEPLREAAGLSTFFNPSIAPAAQVYVDLVGALFMMNNMYLYLGTPYSPFHRSGTHPSLLDRSAGAIDTALADRKLVDPAIRANFVFLRESLAREESIGRQSFVEVVTPGPINDASFDANGLLITTLYNKSTLGISRRDLALAAAKREIPFLQRIRAPFSSSTDATRPGGPVDQPVLAAKVIAEQHLASGPERDAAMWSRPDGTTVLVDGNGRGWRWQGGAWHPYSLALPRPFTTSSCFKLMTPPQPSSIAVTQTCDEQFGTFLQVFKNDGLTANRSYDQIRSELTERVAARISDISILAIEDDGIYLAIESGSGKDLRLLGLAVLGLDDLGVREVREFLGSPAFFRRDSASDKGWPLLVMPGRSPDPVVYFKGVQVDDKVQFQAWYVSNRHLPTPILSQEFLINRVAGRVTPDLIADFDPYFIKTVRLGHAGGLVYFANDSVYFFDAVKSSMRVIFHPSSEDLEIRAGGNGMLALFLRGGSRIFLFNRLGGGEEL